MLVTTYARYGMLDWTITTVGCTNHIGYAISPDIGTVSIQHYQQFWCDGWFCHRQHTRLHLHKFSWILNWYRFAKKTIHHLRTKYLNRQYGENNHILLSSVFSPKTFFKPVLWCQRGIMYVDLRHRTMRGTDIVTSHPLIVLVMEQIIAYLRRIFQIMIQAIDLAHILYRGQL